MDSGANKEMTMSSKQMHRIWSKIDNDTASGIERLALAFAELDWELRVRTRMVNVPRSVLDLPIARRMWISDAGDLRR